MAPEEKKVKERKIPSRGFHVEDARDITTKRRSR
jgi:hypothetical protein